LVQRGVALVDEIFRILGSIRVRISGELVEGSTRDWHILGALLAHPGERFSFSSLIDWVWPDDQERPRNPAQTFHTYAGRIRSLLRKLDVNAQLVGRNGTLRLDVDKALIDYHRFRAMMAEAKVVGQDGDRRRARDIARAALQLWTGPPLAGLDTSPAVQWRSNTVENQWIPANVFLIGQYIVLGDPAEAMLALDDVQEEHPNHIGLVKQRIAVLRQLNRNEDATNYYFALRRHLKVNADDDAAEDLRRFYDDIRSSAVSGPGPAPLDPVEASGEHRRPLLRMRHGPPHLVGRDDLVGELDRSATAEDGRLRASVLVLDGAGGVGKTALAVSWARRRHERDGDGAFLVDLRGFGNTPPLDPDNAVDELLHALGYPVDRIDTARGRAAKLRELLSGMRAVVILDNVRDSSQVLPLLPLLSSCLVVITARRRLAALDVGYGVHSITVTGLGRVHAASLIARRIGDRAADDTNAVDQLAALCGGLPLALNLVAHNVARRTGIPLGDFVEHFRDPRVLLETGGGSDDEDRSLRMVFSTSYEALHPSEQRVFRLLGLHFGPDIGLSAASALAALSADECRRSLDTLVDAHLLEQQSTLDRFRLHDLFRAYATSLVETVEPHETRWAAERRLLDFYLHSAYRADRKVFAYRPGVPVVDRPVDVTPLDFADEQGAADFVVRERVNLTEAVRLAHAHGFFDHGWLLPHAMHGIFKRYGFYQEIRVALGIAVESARRARHAEAEGASLSDLGLLCLDIGDTHEARKLFHYSTFLAESTSSDRGVTTSLHHMARLEIEEGNIQHGIDLYEQALERSVTAGDVSLQAAIMQKLGDVFRMRKQYERALTYYQSALQTCRTIRHSNGLAVNLSEIAMTYCRRGTRGDHLIAQEYGRQALAALSPVSDVGTAQRAWLVMAEVLLRSGKGDAAVRHARRAVALASTDRAAVREAQALEMLGRSLREAGDRADAIETLQRCMAIYRDRSDVRNIGRLGRLLADLRGAEALPAARVDSPSSDIPQGRTRPWS
jgi:tetratricopeptide (TPR) repeat protein